MKLNDYYILQLRMNVARTFIIKVQDTLIINILTHLVTIYTPSSVDHALSGQLTHCTRI